MLKKIPDLWRKIPPDWQFTLGGFFISRAALCLWSLVVLFTIPISFQNLDLFGEPVVTAFNLRTSERHVYSRNVDGTVLSFHLVNSGLMVDDQTGSLWLLEDGRAVDGDFSGHRLSAAAFSADDVFSYVGMAPAQNRLLALWQRFDANWYLKIATRGYGPDGSTVYFPLFPLLIRGFSTFMDPLLAGMMISNLALLGTLFLFHRLASRILDEVAAKRSLVYLLAFPTAFFLPAAYTESLFLFFVLAAFEALSGRRWLMSAVWSSLAALTRLQGVLIVIPLFYVLWQESRNISWKSWISKGFILLLIPLATLSFLGYTSISLIETYESTLNARFVLPWENIWAALSLLASGRGVWIDALNLVVTLFLIGMMFATWKKLPGEYVLYSALMLLAPLLRMTTTQPLVSMARYALVIFPVFLVLGVWGENRWAHRAILYGSILLQMYLSAQFFLWGWVG